MLGLKIYQVSPHSIVLVFRGFLDNHSLASVLPRIEDHIQTRPTANFLLDCLELGGISMQGVQALIDLHDQIVLGGGRMAIAKAGPDIYKKLFLEGADLFIPIYDSFKEALADNQRQHGRQPPMHPRALFLR